MISLASYDYYLPEEKIAKFPLSERDESKLLYYNAGTISKHQFGDIVSQIPENTLIVFNNTKVISARLIFHKTSGARIELFLLDPVAPYSEISSAMQCRKFCTWHCTIGNKKKWKNDVLLALEVDIEGKTITLNATLEDKDENRVRFTWDSDHSFADIVEAAGHIPIPPYLGRQDASIDKQRYQTVYSKPEGAVAAPTAGLHFTESILDKIRNIPGVAIDFVTLHVSAGTFRPIKEANILEHEMHNEQMVINKAFIENLIDYDQIICVGTTSLRTIESLYWYGVQLLKDQNDHFSIEKLYPYNHNAPLPGKKEALTAVLEYMTKNNLEHIHGNTSIFIFPGYEFKICTGLITNFHLPKSTLLLLIAAFVGDKWRDIYNFALDNDFRFLSYGDSSFLLP